MKTRLFLFIALIWVLPWLACNFPSPQPGLSGSDGDALRQTLQADSAPLETPSGQIPVTSLPDTPTPTSETLPGASLPGADQNLEGYYAYTAQSGDTLPALAARFQVDPQQILSTGILPASAYIPPGQVLNIPWQPDGQPAFERLLPDGEIVNSPAALDLDLPGFIRKAGGYLSTYSETLEDGEVVSGEEIVQRVSSQSSVNPRLLLAFLEYRSNWVYGYPDDPSRLDYPIGFYAPGRSGLYQELLMTATQLNVGYYGWRQGSLLNIKYSDQQVERLDPSLNAGSVALQHLFSKFYRRADWQAALYSPGSFLTLFRQMFGDPWSTQAALGPLIPDGLEQPDMELPFLPGERWSLTGGPHSAWDSGTPRGALDFSPVTGEATCAVSSRWAAAAAPGVIARASRNALALDLDGDGYEQTGWVVVYYHLANVDLISQGSLVAQDEPLGHPSCEGGRSTGKHVHIARKYNGEWLPADGPLPFVLSGWRAVADSRNYQGSLVKDGSVVSSNPGGSQSSVIVR